MMKMKLSGIGTGKRTGVFALLLILFSFLFFTARSQDHPPPAGNGQLLPFQQDAMDNSDDKLAMQFYQSRDFEKAAQVYERLYEKSPNSTTYFYYLFCLVETKDYKKAEKLVKTQSKTESASLRYLVDLGYIYYRQGDLEKSKKQYSEAIKKLTANQQQIFELAAAFIQRDENEYAIETYKRGRDLMNNSYPFSFELASVYERIGDFKGMLDEYIRLLEVNRSNLQTIQDRLQYSLAYDPNNAKNEQFRKYILEKAQKEPDKPWYAELLWWYSLQQKDFSMALTQAKSLDRRLKEDGGRVFQLAGLCISNEKYESAIDAYSYLISKGDDYPYYTKSRIELLNTRFLKILSVPNPSKTSITEIEKEFEAETKKMGESNETVDLFKNMAHLEAFYLGEKEAAIIILNRIVDNGSIDAKTRAKCKMELADVELFAGDVWEATLLYQQVYQDYKNDVMGEQAKFKNAKLSYYIGEFKWAQTQVDILKAATSRLIANDAMALSLLISENFDPDSSMAGLTLFSHADLLEYRNEDDAALVTLDSIFTVFPDHPIFDDAMLKKAKIRMKQGKFTEADTLLGTLVVKYPTSVLADEALMLRAQLNENQIGNKPRAMGYYEELMSKFPGSVFVVDARKRFRILRGDSSF